MAAVRQRHFHARQFIGRFHGGDGAHRLLCAADVAPPARRFALHQAQLARDVERRHLQCRHARLVELHLDLAVDAAHAVDGAHAGHGQEALGHRVVDEPGQVGRVERIVDTGFRRGDKGQHHASGGGRLGDGGVAQLGRHVRLDAGDGVAHIVDGFGDLLFQDEFDGHRDDAIEHLGVDVFHALQGGDGVFDLARHFRFQLGRRGAG